MWVHPRDRPLSGPSIAPDVVKTVRFNALTQDPLGNLRWCENDETQFSCMREPGHPGRHIATGTHVLVAAWPGDHEPTMDDLKGAPDA